MDIEREKELYSQIEGFRGQMEGLYDEIKALKRALDFYSDRRNYRTPVTVCMSQFEGSDPSPIARDSGRLARIALTTKV